MAKDTNFRQGERLIYVLSSDADADVLADYVLALLRHDGDIETVRRLCEEEIPDFLKEGRNNDHLGSPLLTIFHRQYDICPRSL